MTRQLRQHILTVFLTALCASASILASTDNADLLKPVPVVTEKSAQPLTANTRQFLATRNPETARVWVFFTDKGVETSGDFAKKASAVRIEERAMRRRVKVEKDEVLFVDLPVSKDYVNNIESFGAKFRQNSRWLNAASFDVPQESLDQIAALPYVARIAPVAGFHTDHDVETRDLRDEWGPVQPQAADVLNYGSSAAQLNQIHVPQVHAQGYDGSGVTLAIFDTGFRKSHDAFAQHYLDGRVLGEWDFVQGDGNTANEAGDAASQWSHGTLIWSVSGGFKDGSIYGPAYKANFLLAKTEDVSSETPVEEDNWVAALEWADSAGADVVTSSLAYSDWYTYADFDGNTATITLAANTAAGLGIVVCNAMANSGPGAGTLAAPADAFDILSVGAVNSGGTIASFSSRGPTFDGRTKPEVCAQGVSTFSASSGGDLSYTTANGTSLSTPLIGGAACLMVQAHPTYTPQMIRQAFMETASRADIPDNNYGWGILNLESALSWGVSFTSDVRIGDVPLHVNFTSDAQITPLSYLWDFGDGDSSTAVDPSHTYAIPGEYTVSLTIQTASGPVTNEQFAYIAATSDTLKYEVDSAYAGQSVEISVSLHNTQSLEELTIPVTFQASPALTLDGITLGSRTSYFESLQFVWLDPGGRHYAVLLKADNGGGSPALAPGDGEVLKISFTIDSLALGPMTNVVDTAIGTQSLKLSTANNLYVPQSIPGAVKTRSVLRGDFDNSGTFNILDVTRLVSFLFAGGTPPLTHQHADVDGSGTYSILDVNYLVSYMFAGGPHPPTP